MSTPFHLAWFLGGSTVQAWGDSWSGSIGRDWATGDLHVDVARMLERACFDFVLIEDNVYVPDAFRGSSELYARTALGTPRLDPTMLAPYMLQATHDIGVVPTVSTFAYHPYLLARQLGSLDHLSGGRAGWNMVTGSSDRAVQNFGFAAMEDHDARYDAASEFTELAFRLWDSWEPDAIRADEHSGIFADHTKIHTVDFEGVRYRSRGPLNIGPSPQGRPVMAQAGTSPRGRDFAARHADAILGDTGTVERMRSFRDDIRARCKDISRDPDTAKVLYVCAFTLGGTQQEAQERFRQKRLAAERDAPVHLATISKMSGIDFGAFPLDEPLRSNTPFETNGTRIILEDFLARNEGRTLRQAAAAHHVKAADSTAHFVGTPASVAAEMSEIIDEVGGDGFLCSQQELTRRTVAEVADGLIPALRRLGVVRERYTGGTLRDNLLEF